MEIVYLLRFTTSYWCKITVWTDLNLYTNVLFQNDCIVKYYNAAARVGFRSFSIYFVFPLVLKLDRFMDWRIFNLLQQIIRALLSKIFQFNLNIQNGIQLLTGVEGNSWSVGPARKKLPKAQTDRQMEKKAIVPFSEVGWGICYLI